MKCVREDLKALITDVLVGEADASVKEQCERFGEVAREYTASSFEWATHSDDRSRLWKARHHVFWANKSFLPGAERSSLVGASRKASTRRARPARFTTRHCARQCRLFKQN